MEGERRGLLYAVLASFLLTQVLSSLPPSNPKVYCPAGHSSGWQYNNGAGRWGTLCADYQKCSFGTRQSPVDIPSLTAGSQSLQLDLNLAPVNIIRTQNLFTMPTPTQTGTLTWRNQLYDLKRIEFHSPSEHTIAGRRSALEVQLYFSRPDPRNGVAAGSVFQAAVSFLFNVANSVCDDPFLASILPGLPSRYRCTCGNNRTESFAPFNEQCDTGSNNANLPNRCRLNCKLPSCGDNITDSGEQCDDGAVATPSCRPGCKKPYCGDGIKDAGEVCDSGAWFEGSGCTGKCTLECGDACLQPGEECDYGIPDPRHSNAPNATAKSVCRTNCLWSRCGDGILDLNEECDEGDFKVANNTGGSNTPNACRPNCTLPVCGDGILDTLRSNVNWTGTVNGGEQCEVAIHGDVKCQSNCRWTCGNNVTDANNNETCDNGLLNSNSAYTNASLPAPCRRFDNVLACRPASCGDGITDPALGEDCDSFGVETALCFANCTFRCGNRYIDVGHPTVANETCDNGNPAKFPNRADDGNSDTRPNACRMDCHPCICGDGIVDPVGCEQCDNGDANSRRWPGRFLAATANSDIRPNACRSNCKFAHCGDSIIDAGEECDDGNNIDDDGCSCCKKDCGNGIKQGNEDCDDGSANSNTLPDRCRTSCTVHRCGDGVTDSDEECDPASGRVVGCTAACKMPFCGDGVPNTQAGEECDAGSANSYSTLGGCSPICTLNICGQSSTLKTVNLQTLASRSSPVVGAFHYQGSETKPPCTENVDWFISPTIRSMTPYQFNWFSKYFFKNNRPVQRRTSVNVITVPNAGVPVPANDPRNRPVCGNGRVELGEQCDNGIENSNTVPDACRTNCKINYCGDGVVDSGEDCDPLPGDYNNGICTRVCKFDKRKQFAPARLDACWNLANQGIWDSCNLNQCNTGLRQSPIRLPASCPAARPLNLNHPSNIQYNPTPLTLFNTGNNMLLPVQSGGTFNYKGVTYTLNHIEFHEPSEHYIGSKRFAFEVQLLHTAVVLGQTKTVVLSVLFDESNAKSAFLQPILDRLPHSECRCGNGIKEDIMVLPGSKIVPEECDDGARNNDHLPNMCRTNCRMAYCGDGVIDSKEQCDAGVKNANAPNTCRLNCVTPYCGDGIVDNLLGEHCDDGNNREGDGCDGNCKWECGNGNLDFGEICDSGALNSDNAPNACRKNCKPARCGDGVVDSGEECDSLTNGLTPDSCRATCTLPFCGDGVTDPAYGEQCDGGLRCSASCTLLCGNGVVDAAAGEECDEGSYNGQGTCRSDCSRARCGDLRLDTKFGEECDDTSAACDASTCKLRCGNGILDFGEECDDGPLNSNTKAGACRKNCKLPSCGDSVIDANEECDAGAGNANTANKCRTCCKVPCCGDGIVDAGEDCDDGNKLDGDTCSSSCKNECGNGILNEGEQCDNGALNSNAAGACRRTCVLPRCGDGITDPGEQCDDGSSNVLGPNSCRPDCTRPFCGDGVIDHAFGEICDQGPRNSLTTIDGCSPACTPNSCRQGIYFNVTVNPAAVIPTTAGTVTYQGSTNAPPCQDADWFVFTTPQSISSCQLAQFRRVLSGNTRCLQARNGRPVTFLEVATKCGDGIVEGNEECDNGPANSDTHPNACRRDCRKARCGDGVRDDGEVCDGTPNCGKTCQLACA